MDLKTRRHFADRVDENFFISEIAQALEPASIGKSWLLDIQGERSFGDEAVDAIG